MITVNGGPRVVLGIEAHGDHRLLAVSAVPGIIWKLSEGLHRYWPSAPETILSRLCRTTRRRATRPAGGPVDE